MNVLQDPKLKDKYDKCKYTVKLWENQFKKDKGRLPSKLDIREASREVRNAYKIYFHLKTAALEESLMHIDGFDVQSENANDGIPEEHPKLPDSLTAEQCTISEESSIDTSCSNFNYPNLSTKVNSKDTWGLHLSKKKTSANYSNNKSNKPKVNLSFSQKLFEGSKLSKRLPRKSLSFNRKKSESDSFKPQFCSQPDPSFAENSLQFEPDLSLQYEPNSLQSESDIFGFDSVKTAAPVCIIQSQSINIIESALSSSNNNKGPLRNLDMGWIERVSSTINSELLIEPAGNEELLKTNYDSDDVIDNSEDEQEDPDTSYHTAKKQKIVISPLIVSRETQSTPFNVMTSNLDVVSEPSNFSFSSSIDTKANFDINQSVTDVYEFNESESEHIKTLNSDTNQNSKKSNNSVRKSKRNPKKLIDLSRHSEIENEDPFGSDDDVNDPEFDPKRDEKKRFSFLDNVGNETDKKHKSKVKTKESKDAMKRTKKAKSTINEAFEDDNSEKYELEYSIKPRTVTTPRINNLKTIVASKIIKSSDKNKFLSEEPVSDKKTMIAEKKLKQKVESGTLNDNYVQINLRKKIFVRGKSNWSFNKYKKQQWKQKKNALYGPNMDMGGCDGGMLTCFKCGQVGHFARNCKTAKGDSLLPVQGTEEEEDCPYPTLEEAAKMAQESVLAIKKPNYIDQLMQKETEEEISFDDRETTQNAEIFDGDEDDEELLAETERLEKEIAKINTQKYIDTTTHVRPYYSLKEDGSMIETPNEVFDVLHQFGHEIFRNGQEQAIMRILSGKSTLVTLSTGSGKSLCYQLPAYLYTKREPCIILVISPLVSLMEDQVTGIPGFLKAACLHTNQTKIQRDKIMDAISTGNLSILLVSPEAVVAGERSSGFGSLLRKLPPIAFACIDEAHCVSQWSHNFRPSYLKICHVLKDRLGVNTILGLTATATRATGDSIIKHLSIPDGRDGIIQDIPLPNNLKLTVSRDAQRDRALVTLLLSDRFKDCKSIIVYCTRREECQRVATYLRTCLQNDGAPSANSKKRKRFSMQAESYHAGLSASRRKSIQKAFMSGELRIVVATVAFGMGINKPDIRAVIHYNMPMSFESYVQEVGRAGRDGLPAHCHLFLDSQGKDENELCRHIYANSTDRHVIRKLLQRCFVSCSCKTSCPSHEVAFSIEETVRSLDIPEENIETLLCYLELHSRHRIELLSHAYVTCKIISYGGPNIIRKTSKECPPLAMALALCQKDRKDDNVFEFPVVDVASAMGWDSGICKLKLKNLEWITEHNQPKRSKLTVQFLNLGFRLNAPGNLTESELDETLDSLYNRVREQEHTLLLQLHAVYTTLTSVANSTFRSCISVDEVSEKENLLKAKIREYFESPSPLELLPEIKPKLIEEDQIIADIRSMVCMYRDNSFTGRAVARIFHGIQSPNYPAVMWGRCKFWRAHLGADFNILCQIATREILQMR